MSDTDDQERDELDQIVQRHDEERAAHDELILDEVRTRHDHARDAEVADAIKRADLDDRAGLQHRRQAADDRRLADDSLARGQRLLREAAENPEAVDAEEKAEKGHRLTTVSSIAEAEAAAELRRADWYRAAADDTRRDARPEQPDPIEAVQQPPQKPPVAQQPQPRKLVRRNVKRTLPGEGVNLDITMDRDTSR
ncbi:hypothetical protein AB0E69_31935 [Kribbella sp. NPDC026611]|uniref:hypothetical protein n=1 Tax=Kribbella sp. NPDC026611 TaxID=3154911 RepID=UPI0033E09989